MDAVQKLMDGVGQAQLDGTSRAVASPSPTVTTRRTKMVFVYSDEDEAETGVEAPAEVSTRGVAALVCEADAIAVSEDALAEMRADAHAMDAPDSGEEESDDGQFCFQEDVLSGLGAAVTAPGLTEALLHYGASQSGGSRSVRVKEVAAPALWEGALAAQKPVDGDGSQEDAQNAMPALLRRGLPAATFVLASRRKRFRDTEGDAPSSAAPPSTAAAATTPPASSSSAGEPHVFAPDNNNEDGMDSVEAEAEEVEDFDVQPVYEEDGQTVRALQTRGGYQLTLDERDLLEGNDDDEDEVVAGEEDGAAAALEGEGREEDTAVALSEAGADEPGDEELAGEAAAAAEEDWADFFDDEGEDEDDEEEEELDEAIVVAVVEQLVRCCEADDVDSQLSIEVGRFTAAAKPLLKELTDGNISPKEFGQRIDRDLRRFQRIYRIVYRPRDSPIVIDGVLMDM